MMNELGERKVKIDKEKMGEIVADVEELPKAIVRRVVKEKLDQLSNSDENNNNNTFSIHKDALLAFSEGARIFIHYLSATANDICRDSKRQTINADDVLKALEEIEFSEFLPPLKASLDEFRKKNAGKRARATKGKEETRKKKKEEVEEPPVENEDNENNQEEDKENSQDGAYENNQDDEENKHNEDEDEDEHEDDATVKV